MKPAFAIIDWDMFVRPICCYVGPDEIPPYLLRQIKKECRKSRYGDVITTEFVKDWVARRADGSCFHVAETENDARYSAIRVWEYSDPILAHEILHVVDDVCEQCAIEDGEFKAYALQWLFCDLRSKLTGRFDMLLGFNKRKG